MPYRAVVVTLLLAAVGGAAADQSTPLGALKVLAIALDRGDEAAIRGVLYAEPDQPKQAKLRDGIAALAHAAARMRQAAVAAYGSENARELAGEPDALEQELAEIGAATVKIESTSAGPVARVEFVVKPALTLRRVDGKWVRPIAEMSGWIDTEEADVRIVRLQSRAQVFDAVADDIAAGKYKTAEAAAAALKQRLTDAEIRESDNGKK